jgi:hypothetical protein
MAQLSEDDIGAISEALERWRRKRPFESALSAAVNKRGGTFEDYIRIISELREMARSEGLQVHEMARHLISPDE